MTTCLWVLDEIITRLLVGARHLKADTDSKVLNDVGTKIGTKSANRPAPNKMISC